MEKMKIYAVDDNPIIQKLIYLSLKDEYNITVFSESVELFLSLAKELPDLILLDIMLPKDDGFEICTKLKANKLYANIPVIFLSAKTGSSARMTGYNLGAINYIEKPFQIAELKSIIRSTILSKSMPEDIISVSTLQLDLAKGILSDSGNLIQLKTSEFKLLAHFVKNENKVFTRQELVEIVSPHNPDVTPRVIDNFISSLRKKVGKSGLSFKTVYNKGYILIITSP